MKISVMKAMMPSVSNQRKDGPSRNDGGEAASRPGSGGACNEAVCAQSGRLCRRGNEGYVQRAMMQRRLCKAWDCAPCNDDQRGGVQRRGLCNVRLCLRPGRNRTNNAAARRRCLNVQAVQR